VCDEYGFLVSPAPGVQVLRYVSRSLCGVDLAYASAMSYGVLPESYDTEAYTEVVNVAQSMYVHLYGWYHLADLTSYFFTLVGMQWGNLLATRTRRLSIFQHNPFTSISGARNWWIPPAMLASLAFLFFFSYVPFFQNTFLTRVSRLRAF